MPAPAEVVVVAADQPLKARCPELPVDKHPRDAEVPACGEGIARKNLPVRKRCALIVAANFKRGRDGAEPLVSVPAGAEQAITVEVPGLASAGQAVLAPEDGRRK